MMEKRVAEDLLDEGGVIFRIGRRRFTVKKLKLGTIFRISKVICSMQEVNERQTLLQGIFENSINLKLASRVVALAILNSFWTNWLHRAYAFWLFHRLTMSELAQLTKVVAGQIGAQDFFFTMTLTKGMNFLRKKEAGFEEGKPSTEP